MPPISVMMKPVSGTCNMFCDYCFYCDIMQKREQASYGFMSLETMKNTIRKTIPYTESGVSYLFQGGEPTLRGLDFYNKAVEYQKQYNKNGIRISNSFQTNGYAIDEKWCQFFKDNDFLISISVDGTKEIHDTYRHTKNGCPTYDRIKQSTELLDWYGVKYNVLTVVNQKVAANIKEIYKEYAKNGWKYQQYIACLDPMDEPHGQKEYSLRPAQYGEFLIELFNLWYEDCQKGKQPIIKQFENYIGILCGYQPETCEQQGKCGIKTVVEADGSVYPCNFYVLDSHYLGNLNNCRMDWINERRKQIGFVEHSLRLSEECRECQYYSICRGGCQRSRDSDNKTGLYHNYFCESYQMFFASCYEKMKEIASHF